MSLWPRNKPLAQPPHFRTGSVPQPPPNPVERATLVALNHARNDRSQPKSRKVAQRAGKPTKPQSVRGLLQTLALRLSSTTQLCGLLQSGWAYEF